MTKNISLIAAAFVLGAFSIAASAASKFEWVTGTVTSFTAQFPTFTVAIVGNKVVRFCNPQTGSDYPVNATDVQYDLLKAAFLNNKKVQVGVQNFGNDAQSGTIKLCIDRVILTN